MVVKTEKINCMGARLNPLLFFNGQSAAKPRIEEGSTTIPLVIKNNNRSTAQVSG